MSDNLEKLAPHSNRARADLRFGQSSARFEVEVTPVGLVAIGILVSGILLSVVPIVSVGTRHLRLK